MRLRQAPIDLDGPVDGLDDPSDRQGLRVGVQAVASRSASAGLDQLGPRELAQDLEPEPCRDGHTLSQSRRAHGSISLGGLLGQKAHHAQGVIRFLCDLHGRPFLSGFNHHRFGVI